MTYKRQKENGNERYQEYQRDKGIVRMLLRTRLKFQDVRKAQDNQIGRKADGKDQNLTIGKAIQADDWEMFIRIADEARRQEKEIEKDLDKRLKRFSIHDWLKQQKGVGTIAMATILGHFDIYKATTVSKMWQFAGLNPGLIRGKKSVKKKDYKPEMGEIERELPPTRKEEKRIIVITDTLIRGDQNAPGFLSPFNKTLRTALVGVLADGFIKAQAPYALDHYYALHIPEQYRTDKEKMKAKPHFAGQYGRLDLSERITQERKKGGKIIEVMWKDTTDGHRDRAAKRKMIKEFLKDLYAEWRKVEGLEVRVPYAEEYLGKMHKAA